MPAAFDRKKPPAPPRRACTDLNPLIRASFQSRLAHTPHPPGHNGEKHKCDVGGESWADFLRPRQCRHGGKATALCLRQGSKGGGTHARNRAESANRHGVGDGPLAGSGKLRDQVAEGSPPTWSVSRCTTR